MPIHTTSSSNSYVPSIDINNIISTVLKKELQDNNLSIEEAQQRLYDNVWPVGYTNSYRKFTKALKGIPPDFVDPVDMARDRIWAKYLNIPKSKYHKTNSYGDTHFTEIEPSEYSPSQAKDKSKYFRLNRVDAAPSIVKMVDSAINLGENQNRLSLTLAKYFGKHTIGKGFDKNGTYVSYYDLWDLNPLETKEDLLQNIKIGNPINFYDRFYLDDFLKLNDSAVRGTHYLPNVDIIYNINKKKKVYPRNSNGKNPDHNTPEGNIKVL